MLKYLNPLLAALRNRRTIFGVAALAMLTAGGCIVREEAPPGRYYYDQYGRLVYVRGGYAPPPTVVVGPAPAPAPAPAPVAGPPETPAVVALEPLVAPIALYPDPLLAVVLPASTYPSQVQEAGAWLAANPQPTPEAIDGQPWDPSIKALVRYPDALNKLTADMQWTESLGSAYLNQQKDVMAAIQHMRAQAAAQNNLPSNAQQTVVQDGGYIAIEPASPQVIYVPAYDPVVVYTTPYSPVAFAVGYPIGPWFAYGFDWYGGSVFIGDWHGPYLYEGGYWHRDRYWRGDHFQHWERDRRFGAPPHIEHYAYARGVRGREMEIHHTMVQHSTVRHEYQRNSDPRRSQEIRGQPRGGQQHGGQQHGHEGEKK